MMDRIEMSGKEVKRLEVLRQVADGVVSQRQAGRSLGLSERQVRRLLRRYEAEGAAGLVSCRRGKPLSRSIDAAVKDAILGRVRSCYAGFGPTLAACHIPDDHKAFDGTARGWI